MPKEREPLHLRGPIGGLLTLYLHDSRGMRESEKRGEDDVKTSEPDVDREDVCV